jgi:hypothetical protein
MIAPTRLGPAIDPEDDYNIRHGAKNHRKSLWREIVSDASGGPFMTDPNPDLDPDEVEQANVAAAAIAGFTLAQFAFGELIKSGILAKGDAEHLLRQAIETHETAGPGNRGAAELLAVVLQSLSAIQPPTRQ